jgi:hypothetical protein
VLKVTREIRLDNKGARIFKFDNVPNDTLESAVYDAGVQLENNRFERGSFASTLFDQLLPVSRDSSDGVAKSTE